MATASFPLQAVRDEQGRTCFALVSPPQFANLLFYCVPPSMRDTFASVEQCTPEILASLGKVAPKIKDRMQKKGMFICIQGLNIHGGFNSPFSFCFHCLKPFVCQ